MSIAQFETVSLYVLITGLILFMCFIMWDLAKRSEAGRFGSIILFSALGIGLLGFVLKTIFVEYILFS
jgi:hypothetical protein